MFGVYKKIDNIAFFDNITMIDLIMCKQFLNYTVLKLQKSVNIILKNGWL